MIARNLQHSRSFGNTFKFLLGGTERGLRYATSKKQGGKRGLQR